MTDPALTRDLGRLEAKVENLTDKTDQMAETLAEMKEKMDRVEGGWGALIWIGGTIAAISAFVGGIITTYLPKGG